MKISHNKQINIVLFVFSLYTIFNFCVSFFLFFSHYPENYNWTELFINYQGGFIRRGFIGEILFQSAKYIDIRLTTASIFIVSYIAFVFVSMKFFKKTCDTTSFLLIVLSPGLLFFFAQDRYMFCRKDVFFELGFILQFYILSSKNIGLRATFIYILFIYSRINSFLFYSSFFFIFRASIQR